MRVLVILCGLLSFALSDSQSLSSRCLADPTFNLQLCLKTFQGILEEANKLKQTNQAMTPQLSTALADEIEETAQSIDNGSVSPEETMAALLEVKNILERLTTKAKISKRLAFNNEISGNYVQTAQNVEEINNRRAKNHLKLQPRLAFSNDISGNYVQTAQNVEEINNKQANDDLKLQPRLAFNNEITGDYVQTAQNVEELNLSPRLAFENQIEGDQVQTYQDVSEINNGNGRGLEINEGEEQMQLNDDNIPDERNTEYKEAIRLLKLAMIKLGVNNPVQLMSDQESTLSEQEEKPKDYIPQVALNEFINLLRKLQNTLKRAGELTIRFKAQGALSKTIRKLIQRQLKQAQAIDAKIVRKTTSDNKEVSYKI